MQQLVEQAVRESGGFIRGLGGTSSPVWLAKRPHHSLLESEALLTPGTTEKSSPVIKTATRGVLRWKPVEEDALAVAMYQMFEKYGGKSNYKTNVGYY